MFQRFAVPSSAGLRSGALAVGVHAVILGLGLRSVAGHADAGKPFVASPDIWVMTESRRPAAEGRAPSIPVAGPIIGPLPVIPAVPSLPGGTVEPFPVEAPIVPDADGPGGGPGRVYDDSVVEQAPELLSAPPPRYPELLRQARVDGTVVIEAVVDTLGRVQPASVRVVSSPHPGLSASAEASVAGALFRPGRVGGRAVRVLVRVPVRFSITGW